MVDEVMLPWEVEKEPKRVLSFINDNKIRWYSTYAMLYAITGCALVSNSIMRRLFKTKT